MSKHQLDLADRQCRMSELSSRAARRWSPCSARRSTRARQNDEVVRQAADIICQDLTRKLTGQRPSDRYFRTATKLGEAIADGGFKSIAGLEADEIMMPYDNN